MSIHKLSAGSGHDYLTRQVAALDATEKGHVGLASYYTERGERTSPACGSTKVSESVSYAATSTVAGPESLLCEHQQWLPRPPDEADR